MSDTIARESLRKLLLEWQRGNLDERQVHEAAEEMKDRHGLTEHPETHPDSIPNEVLSQLDILNHQLITAADIPVMLQFLDTRAGDEKTAWRQWKEYWDALDFDERRHALAGNPYYLT